MAGQVNASKEFLSTFYIPLPGHPIAWKIDNTSLLSELLFDKTILAFGRYDLVFCLKKNEFDPDPAYDTVIVTRTFCETIQIARLPAALRGAAELQTCFSQPLHARIRIRKPLKLNLWDFLTCLITGKTWVEAEVGGQIAADITAPRASCDLALEFEESLPQTRALTTSEQENTAAQQQVAAIDLEILAERVQKIISQRQEEKAVEDKAAGRGPGQPKQSSTPMADAIPPDQEKPGALDVAKVSELVLNILHTREAARARQEQNRLHHPAVIECRETLNTPYPEGTRYAPAGHPAAGYPPAPLQIPLEQIPSRPGLEAFIQNPPPKPPEYGG